MADRGSIFYGAVADASALPLVDNNKYRPGDTIYTQNFGQLWYVNGANMLWTLIDTLRGKRGSIFWGGYDTKTSFLDPQGGDIKPNDYAYALDEGRLYQATYLNWIPVDYLRATGGSSNSSYSLSFSNVSSVTVNHNLNRYPNIVFRDSAGTSYEVDFQYIDLNNVYVSWNGAVTGTITCN